MTDYWRRLPLFFFFFNDTATTEIYTLSLHDALPICVAVVPGDRALLEDGDLAGRLAAAGERLRDRPLEAGDRKSTRLNSSHANISYAVFCLKKKSELDYEGAIRAEDRDVRRSDEHTS